MSLELHTTEELIEELFNRNTFIGVLIRSDDQQKFSGQCHNKFSIRTSGDMEFTVNVMEQTLGILKQTQ